jgi:Ca2+/Na+ antiporter
MTINEMVFITAIPIIFLIILLILIIIVLGDKTIHNWFITVGISFMIGYIVNRIIDKYIK